MAEAITTEGLSKSFGSRLVVDQVDLRVPQGAVFAFLGPNGAGKSTTIRMLLGLIRPQKGHVHLLGQPLVTHRLWALARVGSLVESPSLYPHLTARETLRLYAGLLGRTHRDIERALTLVGLGATASKLVRQFSLGMKQRLSLAQALLAEPQLLILDEPANGLDPGGIQEMRELMRQLARDQGMTVFLSSHLLGEVDQLATDLAILSAGRLVFQGTAHELGAKRRARLCVEVTRPADAAALLDRLGWSVQREEDRLVLAATAPPAAVNRALVEAGFDVTALTAQVDALEQVFFGLTREPGVPS
jgi:lantibiotic transport system ATP-binding protein